MRNLFIAAVAVLGVASISPAMAGDGEGVIGNSQFTQLPGVIAQTSVEAAPIVAGVQGGDAAFVTQSSYGASPFQSYDNGGNN